MREFAQEGYYYLASPYAGSKDEKKHRVKQVTQAAASLLEQGIYAWSPVVHNHQLVPYLKSDLSSEERRNLIMPYDLQLLKHSKGMIILTLEGWESSKGVREEIKFCQFHCIDIYKASLGSFAPFLFEKWLPPLAIKRAV